MWYYWDTWLNESVGYVPNNLNATGIWYELIAAPNGKSVEMTHSRGYNVNRAVKYVGNSTLSEEFRKYQKLAEEYDYNVTIYHFADYSNDGAKYQHFVLIDRLSVTPKRINIPVSKVWLDGNNKYGARAGSITVELLANGKSTGTTITLNAANNWKGEFKNLEKVDKAKKNINYTIKELSCSGYTTQITGNAESGFKITNTLLTEVDVIKRWDDLDNLDEIRTNSVTVTLYRNRWPTQTTATLSEENNWSAKFTNLNKYDSSGKEIQYEVKENNTPKGYEYKQTPTVDSKTGYTTIDLVNKHEPKYDGYIELTGKVWLDNPDGKANTLNGILDDNELGLGGIKVILKNQDGTNFVTNGKTYQTVTSEDGTYKFIINYDNSHDVYKLYEDVATVEEKLDKAYVEFEYDGLKYTTVKPNVSNDRAGNSVPSSKQSKVTELYGDVNTNKSRTKLDNDYSTITPDKTLDKVTEQEKNVIATTKAVITSFTDYQNKNNNENLTTRTENVTLKYCNGDGTYIRTNPDGAWKDILPGTLTCSNCEGKEHVMRNFDIEVKTVNNVNLGLQLREQPDISIEENINNVEVVANGQKYTYMYNAVQTDENDAEVKAQFQNKQSYTYRRPVNPADIAYFQENADYAEMGVYVTYEVIVKNESTTLSTEVNSIINCYDNRYVLKSATIDGNNIDVKESNRYEQPKTDFSEVILSGLNIILEPNKESSKILLRYEVNIEAIKGLLNEDATLSNAVEIETYTTYYGADTLYAERINKEEKSERTGKPYAGYDKDSHPGNAGIKLEEVDYTYTYKDENGNQQTKTFENVKVLKSTQNLVEYQLEDGTIIEKMPEDDTDIAPSLLLCKDEQPRVLSGTVFEDTDVRENNERVGDGKYDSSTEKTVKNVKVELYNADGTKAKIYNANEDKFIDAVVYSNASGNYIFEGVVTGKEYYLKFTYGDDKEKLGLADAVTTINDKDIKINARNYKSTIITDETVKAILNKRYESFTEEDKKWYINIQDNHSIAVDDMTERLKIEDLEYHNFDNALNMTAYSKPFTTLLEFDNNEEGNVLDSYGNTETKNMNKLDFGIIERPREDLFVEKTITSFKITLANDQTLTEGDLTKDLNIPYAKTMGFMQNITNGQQARNALDKQILVELDTELVQGAKLEVQYEVKVTNNNEIDYDYGVKEDYTNIEGWDTLKDYDKYIATSDKAKYYYYGDKTGLGSQNIIKAKIGFVDYLNEELIYQENTSTLTGLNAKEWETTELKDLYEEGREGVNRISKATYEAIKDSKYKVFTTEVELVNGETEVLKTASAIISVNKELSNKDNNVFDNNAEIISIDGKTARTIQNIGETTENIVSKTYKPGNYVPGLEGREIFKDADGTPVYVPVGLEEEGLHEQDDDRVRIIITPPTGIGTYIIYAVGTVVGLVIIALGVIYIKKKILIK